MEFERTSPKPAVASPSSWASSWATYFAVHDVLLLGYLVIVWALLRRAGADSLRSPSVHHVALCFAIVAAGVLVSRGIADIPERVRAGIYRVALAFAVAENYLMLRDVLPVVRPDNVDLELHHVDLALFGVEPALWLERFNSRPVVEYFAFFYYSYFFICFGYLLLSVFFTKPNRGTTEFAIGTVLVYCVGQLGYMAVPAYGPVVALADQFHGPVNGGLFWGLVRSAVEAGGAAKDVFPSLHTAAPTWFALHAFARAERDPRWRPLAWVTAFFAANIICSTMFLRWHYAIDVVFGLALAFGASWVARRVARWEEARRRRLGLPDAWTFG
jgi:membrane-associated phospholipid phosphatase